MSTCKDCIHFVACVEFWYSDYDCSDDIERSKQKHANDKACAQFKPTADVVEVVRCKDCKHHPDNGGECDRSITHTSRDYVCEVNTYRYIGLDYCSYGERKENGT